jgi:hypothetical protein
MATAKPPDEMLNLPETLHNLVANPWQGEVSFQLKTRRRNMFAAT